MNRSPGRGDPEGPGAGEGTTRQPAEGPPLPQHQHLQRPRLPPPGPRPAAGEPASEPGLDNSGFFFSLQAQVAFVESTGIIHGWPRLAPACRRLEHKVQMRCQLGHRRSVAAAQPPCKRGPRGASWEPGGVQVAGPAWVTVPKATPDGGHGQETNPTLPLPCAMLARQPGHRPFSHL